MSSRSTCVTDTGSPVHSVSDLDDLPVAELRAPRRHGRSSLVRHALPRSGGKIRRVADLRREKTV